MGRRELPVDYTVWARGRLARALRELRVQAGLTYDELAVRTGLSAATLKRAASGRTVPAWETITKLAEACDGTPEEYIQLWRSARAADRGRMKELRRPPAPALITTAGQFSETLEYLYESSGAPSLRELQARAGGAHLLPISSAARIVTRQALPASHQQCAAFLTALGIGPGQLRRLVDAYDRITAHSTAPWRALSDLEEAFGIKAATFDVPGPDDGSGLVYRLDPRNLPRGVALKSQMLLLMDPSGRITDVRT
ncbi:helix-turn-helix transcriptional regulator [Streptomyces sp. NPDC089919]|uniref:helix-turn-helix domain-containing protein n=1 Tax=Streptomyces sp. NPDC089919 TaxID=3155188 RepID=UPI003434B26E